MFKRITPFYNADGAEGGGGWDSMIQSSLTEAPVDDGQPAADPDTETLAEGTQAEGQDVVEPDPDEATEAETLEDKPAFDDETEVDLGEGRQPVKLVELKQGYLRQSDYTKKTQELAAQRKEMETQIAEWKPVKDWMDFVNANPYLMDNINQAIRQWQQTGEADWDTMMQDAEAAKWVNGFRSEAVRLAKENEQLKAKLGETEFTTNMDRTMNELRAEYGELITPEYESELRQQAKEQSLSADLLKKIAKGDLAEKKLKQVKTDITTVRKETEVKLIQKQQEQKKKLPPQPGQTAQAPSQALSDTNVSWLDLAKSSWSR